MRRRAEREAVEAAAKDAKAAKAAKKILSAGTAEAPVEVEIEPKIARSTVPNALPRLILESSAVRYP